MKLSWPIELLLLLVVAAMFAAAAWAWPQVPSPMPVHWNLQGEVDGFGSKFTGLLLLPLVSIGIYLLMLALPYLDPGRANYESFQKAYNAIRAAIFLILATVYAFTLSAAFGHHFNMTTAIMPVLGVMFFVLGNFMSKIRPNWFVGVRTPWTLSSRLSWNKTHRLAGWLFMLMGGLFFVVALVPTTAMLIAMLTIDAICLASTVVYSYVVYRKDPHRITPAATTAHAE